MECYISLLCRLNLNTPCSYIFEKVLIGWYTVPLLFSWLKRKHRWEKPVLNISITFLNKMTVQGALFFALILSFSPGLGGFLQRARCLRSCGPPTSLLRPQHRHFFWRKWKSSHNVVRPATVRPAYAVPKVQYLTYFCRFSGKSANYFVSGLMCEPTFLFFLSSCSGL